jgi:hypothetical protein
MTQTTCPGAADAKLDRSLSDSRFGAVQLVSRITESIRRHASKSQQNNFLTLFTGECYTLRRL